MRQNLEKKIIIAVGSITNAIRAQQELSINGIKSDIQRVSVHIPKRGCGYCLKINRNGEAAEKIIRNACIRILEVVVEN